MNKITFIITITIITGLIISSIILNKPSNNKYFIKTNNEALSFSLKNNISFQDAYNLLASKLPSPPFIDDKVFVINDEFYFPHRKARKTKNINSNGYYLNPSTGEIRSEFENKTIIFKEGNYNNNGFRIIHRKVDNRKKSPT